MNKKILVVDDEKPIADILQFNLKKEGYQVECAYDGDEALAKAKEMGEGKKETTAGCLFEEKLE